jgi:hypothetical protein
VFLLAERATACVALNATVSIRIVTWATVLVVNDYIRSGWFADPLAISINFTFAIEARPAAPKHLAHGSSHAKSRKQGAAIWASAPILQERQDNDG